MKEDLLHFVWKNHFLSVHNLNTTENEKVEILDTGMHNSHEGPDFLNAKINIDGTLWIGHIEIHVNSSDWIKHQHDGDENYKNVILHIVYKNDKNLKHLNIPTLELKDYISQSVLDKYYTLMQSKHPIPCTPQFSKVSSLHKNAWWTSCLANRWERKTQEWIALEKGETKNWMEIIYHQLAGNFGFKYNYSPFLQLAQSLPLEILQKHQSNLNQMEALLFGQSGLLPEDYNDDYIQSLVKEYHFLRRKYGLKAMDYREWKFMRLRPSNFPTVRIAQLASFLHYYLDRLPEIMHMKSWKEFQKLLPIGTSTYWENHYHFHKVTIKRKKKLLGKSALQSLIINTFAPALYLYKKNYNSSNYPESNIHILESLPKEDNHIIKKWEEIGQEVQNAFDSQALIECYNEFCKNKKCTSCSIGLQILKL